MKIALVGGIYGQSEEYRRTHRITPETTLEEGLQKAGHLVETFGHFSPVHYSDFDIVHVHHLGRGTLRATLDRSSTPLVFTQHAFLQPHARGRAQWPPRTHRMLLPFLMRRIDGFVALSSLEQRYARQRFQLQGALNRVIPNGIHTDLYPSCHIERQADGPWRLLYVGQLVPSKRVDVLLRAVATLKVPFRLRLVYHNPLLERELQQLATELGIAQQVEFLGGKTQKELAKLYNSSDLFTFPSASESLPGVIAEAMLCCLPPVTTDVGGIPEMLGTFGIQVAPNNPQALSDGIAAGIRHYERLRGQAAAMRQSALDRYSVDCAVQQHLALYDDVLRQPVPRRRVQTAALPLTISVGALARASVLR